MMSSEKPESQYNELPHHIILVKQDNWTQPELPPQLELKLDSMSKGGGGEELHTEQKGEINEVSG